MSDLTPQERGRREGVELACKIQCVDCANGKPLSDDKSHGMPYHINGYFCLSGKLRRAAAQAGVALEEREGTHDR